MKARVSLISVFILLSLCQSRRADAQFWKHWFRKDEPPQRQHSSEKKHLDEAPPLRNEPPRYRRKQSFDYPRTEKRARYRIDVLAPLYLDELVKDNKPAYKGRVPEKATTGADFCQGVQLAADTLNKLGFQVDVYIHDVAGVSESPEALVRNKVLDKSDLIIGAIQSPQMPVIAQFAKKHEINFVSAASPSDAGIVDNPYFTILQPTLQTHCEAIMWKAQKQHKNATIAVYRRSFVPLDESAFNFVMDAAEDRDNRFVKVLCNQMPGKETLADVFSPKETNVIIMAIMDIGYADSLLKQLYHDFPAYKFEVYGMPSWRGMADLRKADAFPNLVIYLTAPSYYDLTTQQGRYLSDVCSKSFGTKPNETVCRGYETLFWYAYLLNRYGTIFNENMSDNAMVPFTRYDIKHRWDVNGEVLYNENERVYWYRYEDASYMIE